MNYQTLFCIEIKPNPDGMAWFQAIADAKEAQAGYEWERHEDLDPEEPENGPEIPGPYDPDTDEDPHGLDIIIEGETVYVESSENCQPEAAVYLLQHYLQQFDPNGEVRFTWASTADRPEPGSQFGGACVVTATESWIINDSTLFDLIDAERAYREHFAITMPPEDFERMTVLAPWRKEKA